MTAKAQAELAEASALNVKEVQSALEEYGLDGWLFYFFHDNDPLAVRILRLAGGHFTRRWFYYIPSHGEPRKLVHRIEQNALDSLPGERTIYLGWRELEEKLQQLLQGQKRIAMQYSPRDAVPYISRVDAGMVELVRSSGAEIVSSADLVQLFEARLSPSQLKTHLVANDLLRKIVLDAFGEVKRTINAGREPNEYEIQQFIMQQFELNGLVTNSPPIVAVNEHSASPHYQPNAREHAPIKKGDFLLIDLWAKKREPADAIYADITWTGFVGTEIPERNREIFAIVAGGRDAGVQFIRDAVQNGRTIRGAEVDDVVRNYISARGYGDYFVHRTGHSIGVEVHANGANIDNLETHDERRLIANTCFSIEPGVYLPEFGVRSEIDVFLGENEVIVGGQPIQTDLIAILAD